MKGSIGVLLVLVAALVSAAVVAVAANAALPFKTVAATEALILSSDFADQNAITDVDCVGLTIPKPKLNSAGQTIYHRFRCRISGAYFDVRVVVVLTGSGGFNVHPF